MASQACLIRTFFSQNSISSSIKTEYTLYYTQYTVWPTPGNGSKEFRVAGRIRGSGGQRGWDFMHHVALADSRKLGKQFTTKKGVRLLT